MINSSKHILLVTSEFPPQPGGIGNHAFNLALFLSKESYSVTVLTDQRSVDGNEELNFDESQPFEVIRIKRMKWRPAMYLKRIVKFRRLLKKADVIMASGKFSLWMVAGIKGSRKNRRIAIVHGSEVNFTNQRLNTSIQRSLDRFDHIVAVSAYTAGLLKQEKNKISVIPNGIHMDSWILDSKPFELKGNPVLLTVGRLSERKGQMKMIAHIPEINKRFPEAHYHCIGIPQNKEKYLEYAKQLGVENQLTIHGTVGEEQLKAALSASDMFIMLSQETKTGDVEGFGIAILEANAMGIPAIGSRAMGIPDAIDDGNSGILVEASSSGEISSAIDKIIRNKEHFAQSSRRWAKAHDWDEIIKKYIELI